MTNNQNYDILYIRGEGTPMNKLDDPYKIFSDYYNESTKVQKVKLRVLWAFDGLIVFIEIWVINTRFRFKKYYKFLQASVSNGCRNEKGNKRH